MNILSLWFLGSQSLIKNILSSDSLCRVFNEIASRTELLMKTIKKHNLRFHFPPTTVKFVDCYLKSSWLLVSSCEKATGGGAFKFTDLFKEKLGIVLDKEDEMDCLVAGANFLLKVRLGKRICELTFYQNGTHFPLNIWCLSRFMSLI